MGMHVCAGPTMPHRRRRIIPVLAQKMSGEVRRVSLLTQALHDLRLAVNRLGRELVAWLVIFICLSQVLSELMTRLLRLFL